MTPARLLRLRSRSLCRLLFLFALLMLAGPAQAAQAVDVKEGGLATVGEVLGAPPVGATVTRVQQHPEFERVTVKLPSGVVLPLEATLARANSTPACKAQDLAIYPRFELAGGEILAEADPVIAALCERLKARASQLPIGFVAADIKTPRGPPVLRVQGDAGPGEEAHGVMIPGPGLRSWRPLDAVLLALLLAFLAALPALRRTLGSAPWGNGLGVFVFGLVARLLLSPRGLQLAPDAGFERVVQSWGINSPHPLYGDGYAALHAPLQGLVGWDPSALFWLHLGLSCLAPPLLWAVAWLCLSERWGALTAGLGLALLPVALRLAGSEVAHVPLATFELVAMLAALAWVRASPGSWRSAPLPLVAALAMGFCVHLRPEALPLVLLPLGLLLAGWWRGRGSALGPAQQLAVLLGPLSALLLVGLVLWRLVGMTAPGPNGPVNATDFLSPQLWLATVLPHWSAIDFRDGPFQVFLDLRVTPAILPLLAGLGLWLGWTRRRPVVLLALVWWTLSLLPILPKSMPLMDAWRLQLAGQAPLLLLAGLGVACLPRWRILAPLAVALSAPGQAVFVRELWAGMAAWAFMPGALSQLPQDATVLYADHEVHAAKMAQVGAQLTRLGGDPSPRWRPLTPFVDDPQPGPDLFVWVGLTCRIATLPSRHVANDRAINPCSRLVEACDLSPFAVTTLPEQTDLDLDWLETPVVVGLYRVDGCR